MLVGKPRGMTSRRRHRSRWEDNIKMDLKGVGSANIDCVPLAQDRTQWRAVEKRNESHSSIKDRDIS
jgi:hypothetical protein